MSEDAIVVQLSNRRLFQASARVLDAVADELAQAMARTGDGPPIPAGGPTGGDHDYSLNEIAMAGAYQSSMRTASTVRQRSLAEFLK